MKNTIRFIAIIVIALWLASSANAQTVECPVDMVCISREAAQKMLEADDRAKALEAEVKTKDAAYADLTKLYNDVRVEFAQCSGANTVLKQRAVSDAAEKELLFKMVRPKKIGLVNF